MKRIVAQSLKEVHIQNKYRVTFTNKLGFNLLSSPFTNKICAFTSKERDRLKIRGLVPPAELNLEQQKNIIKMEYEQGLLKMALQDPDPQTSNAGITPEMLRKWKVLNKILETDSTLYYYILMNNIEKIAPIIYTPTVGWICKNFSKLLRKPRGMYLTIKDKGEVMSIMNNWPQESVDAIVMTDGSRILGLGDLGIGGLGISIGKLDLYVAAGGFNPQKTLPIVLDVGTDNEELRNQEGYLGLKQPRTDGQEYYDFIDEVVTAIFMKFPNALLQFEDIQHKHAMRLLKRYRNEFLVFNDDIQGTAAITLGGVIGALKVQNLQPKEFRNMKVFIAGAGSAGMGVAHQLAQYKMRYGMSEEEAYETFYIFDSHGLITRKRLGLNMLTLPFAQTDLSLEGCSLEEVMQKIQCNVLIGLSANPNLFNDKVLSLMKDQPEGRRPIIFPLSNPTSKSECSPVDAYKHTDYQAIVGTGSPFDNIEFEGKVIRSNQTNNSYIFPGLALGAVMGKCKVITDEMMMIASEALSECLSFEDINERGIFPKFEKIREISLHIACKVIIAAVKQGLVKDKEVILWSYEDFDSFKKKMYLKQWQPQYRPYIYKNQ